VVLPDAHKAVLKSGVSRYQLSGLFRKKPLARPLRKLLAHVSRAELSDNFQSDQTSFQSLVSSGYAEEAFLLLKAKKL